MRPPLLRVEIAESSGAHNAKVPAVQIRHRGTRPYSKTQIYTKGKPEEVHPFYTGLYTKSESPFHHRPGLPKAQRSGHGAQAAHRAAEADPVSGARAACASPAPGSAAGGQRPSGSWLAPAQTLTHAQTRETPADLPR